MRQDDGRRREFTAALLITSARGFAAGAAARITERMAELHVPAGGTALDLRRDFETQLQHLAAAVQFGRPELFLDWARWLEAALTARGMPRGYVPAAVESLQQELAADLPADSAALVMPILTAVRAALGAATPPSPPARDPRVARLLLAVLEGRGDQALESIQGELARGATAADLHEQLLGPVLVEIGELWHRGELRVAEEHLASSLLERALALVRSMAPRADRLPWRILAAAVGGEQHVFGLRMAADQLELAGFAVCMLGANLPGADCLFAVQEFAPHLVLLAVQQVPQLRELAATIRELRAGPAAGLPIVVGGRPFQLVPELAAAVGADAHAPTPREAVAIARRLLLP